MFSPIASARRAYRGLPVHRCLKRTITLSHFEGPTEPPLETRTFPEYFEQVVLERYGPRPALVSRQEPSRPFGGPASHNLGVRKHLAWDFGEFNQHINAVARGLLNMGVKKGDRVGVVMGNCSAYACLQMACASIGAILVTLNPAYRSHELIRALNLVGVSHLFVVPKLRSSTYLKTLSEMLPSLRGASPGNIQDEALPSLRNLVVVDNTTSLSEFEAELGDIRGAIDFRETLVWREDAKETALIKDIRSSLHRDETINLQFTSGTTGNPKAVQLSHYNLLNNGINIGRCMKVTEQDILCNVPPLFHCFGCVIGNLGFWTHGACVVYPSESFDPKAIVDSLVEDKCTALHGVPTHFLGVISEVERRQKAGEVLDLSNLRTGVAAGSTVPIDLMKQIVSKLNMREMTPAYGMTETSPVAFQSYTDDPLIQRVETVGRIQPHVKAKVISPEGETVPLGTPGEVCMAGYMVTRGYWEDEEHTSQALKKYPGDDTLWMHSGDEGIMEEGGYLKIVGRIKDMIIRGGENLFPVQIENVLHAHSDIREAAAVAVPDPKFGEVVGAWIVREPGANISRDEVRRWVATSMNPQNTPAWVWFVSEDGTPAEFPKTASGKIQKHILRDWSKELASKDVGKTVASV